MNTEKKLWFRSKRYGWGWTPASKEGWLVTLAFLGIAIFLATRLEDSAVSGEDILFRFALPIGALTLLLIAIAWRTGEKPRWRWGDSKKK